MLANAAFAVGSIVAPSAGAPYVHALAMEPATRIERATCGLRITPSTTSDNLTPQETTTEDSANMGPDGADLSCPGGSVVADSEGEAARFEAPTGSETIDPDLILSFPSQSLTADQEVGGEPIKPRRAG